MSSARLSIVLLSSIFLASGCSIHDSDEGKVKVNEHKETVKVEKNTVESAVLVNKENKLPQDYQTDDLVYPSIPFTFEEKIEKRMLKTVAASAIERLFTAASNEGLGLAGVSAYRSHATQESLFNYYVDRDGLEAALSYCAVPGTSEHETGLAIDVTASDGSCAAEDCFGDTKEAAWLAQHAAEYGFIIRYPEGKEDITGYKYEPWHLRYVGTAIAQEITEQDLTLEEYSQTLVVKQ